MGSRLSISECLWLWRVCETFKAISRKIKKRLTWLLQRVGLVWIWITRACESGQCGTSWASWMNALILASPGDDWMDIILITGVVLVDRLLVWWMCNFEAHGRPTIFRIVGHLSLGIDLFAMGCVSGWVRGPAGVVLDCPRHSDLIAISVCTFGPRSRRVLPLSGKNALTAFLLLLSLSLSLDQTPVNPSEFLFVLLKGGPNEVGASLTQGSRCCASYVSAPNIVIGDGSLDCQHFRGASRWYCPRRPTIKGRCPLTSFFPVCRFSSPNGPRADPAVDAAATCPSCRPPIAHGVPVGQTGPQLAQHGAS